MSHPRFLATDRSCTHLATKFPVGQFLVGLVLLACTVPALAQETGISGSVTDPSGAAVPNAAVSITSSEGTKLSTATNNKGEYQFPALRAATYVVRIEASGFAPAERTLTLLVGQVVPVDVRLRLASTGVSVDVVADVGAVETTSSSVAGNVNPTQMNNVPLNGRNWMELSMLVPGITRNAVSFSPLGTDDQAKFQINIDGQQATQNLAADSFGQPQFSRDAIDQYQIITNRFDATMGRALQIQINAQTKAGSNDFHGTAFGYFRSDTFNASDPVAHKVLPFSDQQVGGTIGGPIKKDRLWFFFSYELERNPNTIFTVPTGFGGESFTLPDNIIDADYLLRIDWMKNQSNRISFRGAGFTWHNPLASVSGTTFPSLGANAIRDGYYLLADWTWTPSPTLVNEVKAGLNRFDLNNDGVVSSGMQFDFTTGSAGANYNYPDHQNQNVQQYRDDLFKLAGAHAIKAGGEYLRAVYQGIFAANSRGQVLTFTAEPPNLASLFPTWNDPSTWNVAAISPYAGSYVQAFGNFNFHIPTNTISFWAQDDWKLSSKLTVNLGLRYDNDIGIFFPNLKIPGVQTPTGGNNLNFAPRLGFAYDVRGDRKTVVRGGAGIYFGDVLANQVYDYALFNGVTVIQPSVSSSVGNPINLLAPFGSTTPQQFLSGAVPISTQTIQALGANPRTPYSLQMSIGVEHQFGSSWTASADYVHWRVYHDWMRDDTNLVFDPVSGYNLYNTTTKSVVRPNTTYGAIESFLTPNAAGSLFDSFQTQLQHRFSKGFQGSIVYTLARMKDSSTGAFYYPNNPFNLAGEWATSPDNQHNTLATTWSYLWKYGLQLSGTFHFGSGQTYATTAAGNPFGGLVNNRTFLTSTKVYDAPSCNSSSSAAGYLVVQRDCQTGTSIYRLDLRFSKTFTIHDRYRLIPIFEAFNVFNHSNFGAFGTVITTSSFGTPAANTNLAYAARMLQFSGRFEF